MWGFTTHARKEERALVGLQCVALCCGVLQWIGRHAGVVLVRGGRLEGGLETFVFLIVYVLDPQGCVNNVPILKARVPCSFFLHKHDKLFVRHPPPFPRDVTNESWQVR